MTIEVVQPKAYSPAAAAKALDVSLPTVYRWLQEGRIRYCQPDRRIIIPATEIDAFLLRLKQPGSEPK
jgi:excisionase family DNA binding protein